MLPADNYSGQNKNNVMLQYLLWQVLTGRHQSVTLSFLITGHTKSSPDGSFGLIKRRFRKTEVNCLADLQDVVTSSSNVNLSQLCGNENGDVFVTSHKWDDFLSTFFKKFEGIKKFQHFRFLPDGSIRVKHFVDTEESFHSVLKRNVTLPLPDALPDVLQSASLDMKRQWYLFNEIRPFVSEEFQDIVTPRPKDPLPANEPQLTADADDIEPPAKRPTEKGKGKGNSK